MNLDIRLPIGLLFTMLGVMLVTYGAIADPVLNERSLGYNLNLIWGAVVLLFGLVMLFLSRRGTSSVERAADTPEGRATEAREHRLGLEDEHDRR